MRSFKAKDTAELEKLGTVLQRDDGAQVMDYAKETNYYVRTEVSGDKSRVDIEIAQPGKFLIHIENKIHSGEGEKQTEREWDDLQNRGRSLGVPQEACHAIFLTLEGTRASHDKFRAVRWSSIANILDQFAVEAEPREVKLFASHFAKAVRKLGGVEREQAEMEAENADVQ